MDILLYSFHDKKQMLDGLTSNVMKQKSERKFPVSFKACRAYSSATTRFLQSHEPAIICLKLISMLEAPCE